MTRCAFVYNTNKNALDNDVLFGSWLFSTTQEKLAQDDDELRGLSSFCATQKINIKWWRTF